MLPERSNAAYATFMTQESSHKMSLMNRSSQKLNLASPELKRELEIGSPSTLLKVNEDQASTQHQSTTYLLNGGRSF